MSDNLGINVDSDFTEEQMEAYTTVGGAFQLDGGYTVFGRVVEGMDVVDKIAAVKTIGERPQKNLGMMIELEPMNKSDITSKYGVTFPEVKAAETEAK